MKRTSYILKILILFVLYYLTARWGLSFDPVNGFATLVWLPTGISLAAVLLYGYNIFPAIVLGAFLANFMTGASLGASFGISIGNTLEAITGAYFLKKVGFRNSLERVRDVLDLIYVSVFATAVSAIFGVTSLYLTGVVTPDTYGDTWLTWWIGDSLSVLSLTPLILVWSRVTREELGKDVVERLLVFIALIVMALIVFRGLLGIIVKDSPVTYLTEPILIWIALRFNQRLMVTGVVTVIAIAIWGTISGLGPFAYSDTTHNILWLQGYIGTMVMMLMLFSAATSERREIAERKDNFISMTAHELKNPITSLNLYTELLRGSLVDIQGKSKHLKYVSFMRTQSRQLTRLVDDLLDLSRISMDRLEMNMKLFNFDLLIAECTHSVQMRHKDHTIIVKGKVRSKVWGDKDRIGQVLTNILVNAIRYSPGTKKIMVKVETQKLNVKVSIQDFGVGISDPDKEKIFDRFYQVTSKGSFNSVGLGIGLYVSKRIIDLHKGKIGVESAVGKGSTFFFIIPRLKEN